MFNLIKHSITKRPILKSNYLTKSLNSFKNPLSLNKRFASSWRNEGKTDNKIEFKWFLLVGVFGTMVYITVMQRIQEQDHSKNIERYKKTFTEEEWEKYINEIQKKQLTLENNEECYLIPFTFNNKNYEKSINVTIDKLGGKENIGLIDLNELVDNQLKNNSKYHILLEHTFEDEDLNSSGFKYKFNYKLKPGIFTQIVNDEILRLKSENPKIGRFIILNYPPNIKEAIKFEQNISNKDVLLVLDNKLNDSDIVQYFDTVDKVINIKDLKKVDPLIIDKQNENIKIEKPIENQIILYDIPNEEPPADAPAITKAQYKLRQLNQPIREYGESDVDVINRLKNLQN